MGAVMMGWSFGDGRGLAFALRHRRCGDTGTGRITDRQLSRAELCVPLRLRTNPNGLRTMSACPLIASKPASEPTGVLGQLRKIRKTCQSRLWESSDTSVCRRLVDHEASTGCHCRRERRDMARPITHGAGCQARRRRRVRASHHDQSYEAYRSVHGSSVRSYRTPSVRALTLRSNPICSTLKFASYQPKPPAST